MHIGDEQSQDENEQEKRKEDFSVAEGSQRSQRSYRFLGSAFEWSCGLTDTLQAELGQF